MQAGEVDIIQNAINRDKIPEISKKNPNLKVMKQVRISTTYLGFNMKDKLTGNAAVRQAISVAIDREAIIKYILSGMAEPARTLLTPADPFLNKDLPTPVLDLKLATKILDDAGFKDPDCKGPKPRFELSYKTTTDVTRINIAKAIASQLKKIGIQVKVESLEWGKFAEDVSKGQVQMWSLSWIGFKDPDIYRFAFSTDSFPPNGANRGWYSNKELDKVLQQAKVTNDLTERKKLYGSVQKTIAEELPYVFLWHEEGFAVLNKDVEGYQLYADGRLSSLVNTVK
jgi:peptide/nickel transport system substrate-binding protein